MNAVDLLSIAEQCQVKIELVDPDHITVDPVDRLPDGMLEQLRQYKYDIIKYLTQQQHKAVEASNDHPVPDDLPATYRRALNGFYYILNRKRQNLNSKGYNANNAIVTVEEWRASVMRVIGLSYHETEQVKQKLIRWGYLAYSNDYNNKLVEGSGIAVEEAQQGIDNDYLPQGITGDDFRAWLYGSDSAH